MAVKIFRWRAISVLLLVLIILGVLWALFSDLILRQTTEEASTQFLGTQVDVGRFRLSETDARVDLGALAVADPFDSMRNLLELERAELKLNPGALAEKKLVIERFSLNGMEFGTRRSRPAQPVSGNGFAPQVLRSVRQWADQFDVPLLQLTPIDTIRQLALDPTQLGTIQAAAGAARRTDSTRQAIEAALEGLQFEATYDSARAFVERVRRLDPRRIAPTSLRDTIQMVQGALDDTKAMRQRVDALERNAQGALAQVGQSVAELDEARRRDYAFARGLLKLPSFDAPDLGGAFFGKVSISRFQQALYWAELARKYIPPWLLPRAAPGPKRLRAAGTNVHFVKREAYPSFLLETGDLDFTIAGENLLAGAYQARVEGLTSAPALYGKPTVFSASRGGAARGPATFEVRGLLNHLQDPLHDSVSAVVSGIELPEFALPGLPFRVIPDTGSSRLSFALRGEAISAAWLVRSSAVRWMRDSTARSGANPLEDVIWRVVSGLGELEITARLSGTISSPRLSVQSNLDQAVANRVKSIMGEELAKAEARVRAEVDRHVADKIGPVQARAAELRRDVEGQLAGHKRRLDDVEQQIQAELKRLAGPAGNLLPRLPRIP